MNSPLGLGNVKRPIPNAVGVLVALTHASEIEILLNIHIDILKYHIYLIEKNKNYMIN